MRKLQVLTGKLWWFPVLLLIVIFLGSFRKTSSYPERLVHDFSVDTTSSPEKAAATYTTRSFVEEKLDVYDSLNLEASGLSRNVFELALKGMYKLIRKGHIKQNILSIIDFSQPSVNKRLYVIDLDSYTLLYNTWVAHGVKSGKLAATYFSNKPASHKSSLGFYVTGETYKGSNGYSLKLLGVEKGINDYAFRRGIVMHGADYVSEEFIQSQGYIGRSYGCPAVPSDISRELIDHVKEGTCLFIYHPSAAYRSKSSLIK
jgi:hypothetical protein